MSERGSWETVSINSCTFKGLQCVTVSPKAVFFHAEAQTFIRAAQNAQIPLLSSDNFLSLLFVSHCLANHRICLSLLAFAYLNYSGFRFYKGTQRLPFNTIHQKFLIFFCHLNPFDVRYTILTRPPESSYFNNLTTQVFSKFYFDLFLF